MLEQEQVRKVKFSMYADMVTMALRTLRARLLQAGLSGRLDDVWVQLSRRNVFWLLLSRMIYSVPLSIDNISSLRKNSWTIRVGTSWCQYDKEDEGED